MAPLPIHFAQLECRCEIEREIPQELFPKFLQVVATNVPLPNEFGLDVTSNEQAAEDYKFD